MSDGSRLRTSDVHPQETELACLDEGWGGADVAEHLRWCARCRSAVADYGWLADELEATLAAAAAAVEPPRPRWWAVQGRVSAARRWRTAMRRASACTSLLLALWLMLYVPGFLGITLSLSIGGPTAIRTPYPEVAPVPAAALSLASISPSSLGATPTPAVPCAEVAPSPTPAFVLVPVPSQPETPQP